MSIRKLNAALLGFVLTAAVGAAGAETGDAPYAYSVSDTYAPPAQAKSADAEKMRERTKYATASMMMGSAKNAATDDKPAAARRFVVKPNLDFMDTMLSH